MPESKSGALGQLGDAPKDEDVQLVYADHHASQMRVILVPKVGLEPTCLIRTTDFESAASTIPPLGHFGFAVAHCTTKIFCVTTNFIACCLMIFCFFGGSGGTRTHDQEIKWRNLGNRTLAWRTCIPQVSCSAN